MQIVKKVSADKNQDRSDRHKLNKERRLEDKLNGGAWTKRERHKIEFKNTEWYYKKSDISKPSSFAWYNMSFVTFISHVQLFFKIIPYIVIKIM